MTSTLIILIIIAMLIILVTWMWHSLGDIKKSTKCTCIVGGLIIVYIITFIIYNISKIGITYEDVETMKTVRTVFVLLFTIINGYIILPYVCRKLDKINNEEMEPEELKKSIIILVIMILAIGIFESVYLGNAQERILSMMNK